MATQSVPPPSYQDSQQMTGTTQQSSKTPQVHIPAASAAGSTPISVTLDPQAQLESDKRAVYRVSTASSKTFSAPTSITRLAHPLRPLCPRPAPQEPSTGGAVGSLRGWASELNLALL
ncbi:hypothetical protein NHX12_009607 [Muraenolepis orangiensis]|uniref:Uncharacterized protein n=1 Tax=Muraenolepis orangiensis TaxID=630683 RepID=A0A9Q0DJN9_9TELE|nr:hypothetical protein NHX12_009607 [Muraenolepis orangiensis]